MIRSFIILVLLFYIAVNITYSKEIIISNFQKGEWFKVTGDSGTVTEDTTDYIRGSQSIKITANEFGKTTRIRMTNISPAINLNNKYLRFYFKVNNWDQIPEDGITFSFSSKPDMSTDYYKILYGTSHLRQRLVINNHWRDATFCLETLVKDTPKTGNPDITKISSIEIIFRSKEAPKQVWYKADNEINRTKDTTIWFNGFSLVETPNKAYVSFAFFPTSGIYRYIKPILEKYGWKATLTWSNIDIFNKNKTLSSKSDPEGKFMTIEQIRELNTKLGWEVNFTFYDKAKFVRDHLTESEIENQLIKAKNWMKEQGINSKGGGMIPDPITTVSIKDVVSKHIPYGFSWFDSTDGNVSSTIYNNLSLGLLMMHSDSNPAGTPSYYERFVNDIIKVDNGKVEVNAWLILNVWQADPNGGFPNTGTVDTDCFEYLCGYIDKLIKNNPGKLEVKPVIDVLEMYKTIEK